ncbi:hypothetical protein HJC23_004653 [Cyclotella cryptica]|uniref:Uncharacterized protein n=1 Tax=Cyclotella cryptica TaxID=29204 RepID=A0ABD3PK53_9STRA
MSSSAMEIIEHPLLQIHPPFSLAAPPKQSRYYAIATPDGSDATTTTLPVALVASGIMPVDSGELERRRKRSQTTTILATHFPFHGTTVRGGNPANATASIDLSRLNNHLSSIIATGCFVTMHGNDECVLVRMVDVHGSILSLMVHSSTLEPVGGVHSLVPFQPSMSPHPGSTLENTQVAFPTEKMVVLALDPYLYGIDFSHGGCDSLHDDIHDKTNAAPTVKVWSTRHRTLYDPLSSRKKPRQSISTVLKEASYTLGLKLEGTLTTTTTSIFTDDERNNYGDDDDDDVDDDDYDDNDRTARLATLHSDGSLRLWTIRAQPRNNQLRSFTTPHVQRIVLKYSEGGYIDPPLPTDWDSYNSIKMTGRVHDDEYELALYLKCLNESRVYVFRGGVVSGDYFGGDCMQEMHLPEGTTTVFDLSWGREGELLVLLQREGNERDEGGIVAVFPRGKTEALLPENKTVSFGVNSFRQMNMQRSVEEELARFFVPSPVDGEDGMTMEKENSGANAENATLDTAFEEKVAKAEARVDKAGLLSLLHPMGRSRPSSLAVHRALRSLNLVDGAMTAENMGPVDIVGAMRRWKKRDLFRPSLTVEEKSLVPRHEGNNQLVPKATEAMVADSNSIYHVFASATKNASRPTNAEVDQDRATAMKSIQSPGTSHSLESAENTHLMRWITFLTEVRRQEARLNEVLCLASVPSSYNLVYRPSMISVISFKSPLAGRLSIGHNGEDLMANLDELSLDMLEFAMSHSELRSTLCHAESILFDAASKASCLIAGWRNNGLDEDIVCLIENLGQSVAESLNLNERQLELLRILSEIDLDFVEEWLYPPSSKSPSACSRLGLSVNTDEMTDPIPGFNIGGAYGQSPAVTIISARLESMRHLSLARLLLILSSSRSGTTSSIQSGLRLALFCTALSWSMNQSSHQDGCRTVLEEHLLQAEKANTSRTSSWLADDFFKAVVNLFSGSSGTSSLSNLMSSAHEPHITLRLLAPLLEYPSQGSPDNQDTTRIAAECLLVEASLVAKQYHLGTTTTPPKDLWVLASNILLDNVARDSVDGTSICHIYEALLSHKDRCSPSSQDVHQEEKVFKVLSAILLIGECEDDLSQFTESQEDIKRLCTMPTMRSLFLPLALSAPVSTDHGGLVTWLLSKISCDAPVPKLALYHFVKTMMNISKLFFRVDTLQRKLQLIGEDSTALSDCCNVALDAINDTISSITSLLPFEISREMPEFATLWSLAFETSLRGNLWDHALRSCLSNPSKGEQNDKFRSLVLRMVDAKALGKLLDMSMAVVGHIDVRMNDVEFDDTTADPPSGMSFDLLNHATKIIEQAAKEQATASTRTADEVEALWKDRPNYWGALYSLHASRGNWKQAAQAMDKCGKAADLAAAAAPRSRSQNVSSINKATSKMIMDEISLSAIACANAVSLTEKPSDRYILPNGLAKGLLTEEDIEIRAMRAMALRALSMDEYSPDSVTTILKASFRVTIDMLARLGYYDHAIALAKGLSAKRKSCPGGVDLFDDSLKHILSKYLVPAATIFPCRASGEGIDVDIQSRSKVAQIRLSSSSCVVRNLGKQAALTSSSSNSKSFMMNKICDEAVQADMAMRLLQQYTYMYSPSCSGLGLHVARSILLASGGNSDLPHWLKDLFIFGMPHDDGKKSGLFASVEGGHNVADPAGLVRLFMEFHRYDDACEVVVSVLSKRSGVAFSPSSRIPEKGNIDFVPYDLIDELWKSIQSIISSNQNSSEDFDSNNKLNALRSMQTRMEKALLKHFELLKLSEEGLKSARALAH